MALNPSFFVQIAVLTLAGLGKFTLWGAVLVDVGTALVVILNGMTVLRWTRHPPGEAPRCAAERYAAEHRCVMRPRTGATASRGRSKALAQLAVASGVDA